MFFCAAEGDRTKKLSLSRIIEMIQFLLLLSHYGRIPEFEVFAGHDPQTPQIRDFAPMA